MRPIEEVKPVLHYENDPKRINALEEIEIMKAMTFDHMLNIMQSDNPRYHILQTLQDQTTKITGTSMCNSNILTNNDGDIILSDDEGMVCCLLAGPHLLKRCR